MTEYLLLFRNASAEDGYLATAQEMAADLPKWQNWIGGIAMQGRLVSTAPVVYDAIVVTKETVSHGPHKEPDTVMVSGYLIAKAESADEAAAWAESCPILQYPGSSVEVRALVPFPI
ncbi:MAG: YciI family protein [Flavobacterium sp.]